MKTLRLRNGSLQLSEVSLYREVTLEEWSAGVATDGAVALTLPNDIDVQVLDGDLSVFDAIILKFPHFKDGRAYSQARRLREQLGFKGDIIARGDLGRDQALFMIRSGINVFEEPENGAEGFAEALKEFSLFYQSAADQALPVWRLRARQALAA